MSSSRSGQRSGSRGETDSKVHVMRTKRWFRPHEQNSRKDTRAHQMIRVAVTIKLTLWCVRSANHAVMVRRCTLQNVENTTNDEERRTHTHTQDSLHARTSTHPPSIGPPWKRCQSVAQILAIRHRTLHPQIIPVSHELLTSLSDYSHHCF